MNNNNKEMIEKTKKKTNEEKSLKTYKKYKSLDQLFTSININSSFDSSPVELFIKNV